MTEYEIEATKDVVRAMDQKEKNITLAVILEERHADPVKLRRTICDGYCYWARVCGNQGALDDHCKKCAISEQWEAVFGRKA